MSNSIKKIANDQGGNVIEYHCEINWLKFIGYYRGDELLFIIDYTRDEIAPNHRLIINFTPNGKPWPAVINDDFKINFEDIRPKNGNKYEKIDIDYQSLPYYSNLINNIESEDILEEFEIARELHCLDEALKRREQYATQKEQAENVITNVSSTLIRGDQTLDNLLERERKLKILEDSNPEKVDHASKKRLEVSIQKHIEMSKRRKWRIGNAEKRREKSLSDIVLVDKRVVEVERRIKLRKKKPIKNNYIEKAYSNNTNAYEESHSNNNVIKTKYKKYAYLLLILLVFAFVIIALKDLVQHDREPDKDKQNSFITMNEAEIKPYVEEVVVAEELEVAESVVEEVVDEEVEEVEVIDIANINDIREKYIREVIHGDKYKFALESFESSFFSCNDDAKKVASNTITNMNDIWNAFRILSLKEYYNKKNWNFNDEVLKSSSMYRQMVSDENLLVKFTMPSHRTFKSIGNKFCRQYKSQSHICNKIYYHYNKLGRLSRKTELLEVIKLWLERGR